MGYTLEGQPYELAFSATTLMPKGFRCLSCGRRFKTEGGVLKHKCKRKRKELLPKQLKLELHKTFKLHKATSSKTVAVAEAKAIRQKGHKARVITFPASYAAKYGVYKW